MWSEKLVWKVSVLRTGKDWILWGEETGKVAIISSFSQTPIYCLSYRVPTLNADDCDCPLRSRAWNTAVLHVQTLQGKIGDKSWLFWLFFPSSPRDCPPRWWVDVLRMLYGRLFGIFDIDVDSRFGALDAMQQGPPRALLHHGYWSFWGYQCYRQFQRTGRYSKGRTLQGNFLFGHSFQERHCIGRWGLPSIDSRLLASA